MTLPWTLWCACVLLVVDVVEVDDDDDDDDDDADNDDTLQQTNSINFLDSLALQESSLQPFQLSHVG